MEELIFKNGFEYGKSKALGKSTVWFAVSQIEIFLISDTYEFYNIITR